jgi:hypothetical protein|tara:strand:- start:2233 stop:2415 length:183 start_codon:yes stop_codon:yes gene_type:complete
MANSFACHNGFVLDFSSALAAGRTAVGRRIALTVLSASSGVSRPARPFSSKKSPYSAAQA